MGNGWRPLAYCHPDETRYLHASHQEESMFSHIVVGSDDLDRSRKFYDAIFTATGSAVGEIDPKGRLVYSRDGARFLVSIPIDGKAASFANGGTIGLAFKTPEEVDAWHAAGVANGGVSIENPPGIREMGPRKLYLAYLRDPYGNKLCARALISG
jgi:catechol 2,3-dioxygenase-like lactoylglutathione lyase family enzyme